MQMKIKTIKCDMCSKESELNIAKSQLSKDIQELIEKNFLDILILSKILT